MRVYLLNGVQNIVANPFEQSLLLSQRFQNSSSAEASESVYMWERVKKNICSQSTVMWVQVAVNTQIKRQIRQTYC